MLFHGGYFYGQSIRRLSLFLHSLATLTYTLYNQKYSYLWICRELGWELPDMFFKPCWVHLCGADEDAEADGVDEDGEVDGEEVLPPGNQPNIGWKICIAAYVVNQPNTLFILSGRQGRKMFQTWCFCWWPFWWRWWRFWSPIAGHPSDPSRVWIPAAVCLCIPFQHQWHVKISRESLQKKRQEDWSTPRSRTSIEKLFPKSWVLRSKAFQALTGWYESLSKWLKHQN